MGLGDLKFMGLVGGFLGPVGVLAAITLACFAGVIYGVPRLMISKQHWMPFGPFLSLGAYVILAFRSEVFGFLERVQYDYAEFVLGLIR